MTILDIISRLDRNDPKLKCSPNWEDISNTFSVPDFYYSEDPRLTAYHLVAWYCTDSYVGMRAYFLDDEFIGISEQVGRKDNEHFEIIPSKVDKVRNYLLSLVAPNYHSVPELDLNKNTLTDHYFIEYGCQLLPQFHKFALYEGEQVEVIAKSSIYSDNFHVVQIKINGELKLVDVRKLKFKAATTYDAGGFEKIPELTKEKQKEILGE